MTHKRTRKFDVISEEKKQAYLKEIITFFQDERDEQIGLVAAESVLEFFLETFAEDIYKKSIRDAKLLIKQKVEDLDIELDLLSGK